MIKLNVRFDEKDVKVLEIMSKDMDLNKSTIIRKAVRQYIEDWADVKKAEEMLSDPNRETMTEEEMEKFIDEL